MKYEMRRKIAYGISAHTYQGTKNLYNILIQNLSTQATLNSFKAAILLAIPVRPARWAIVCLLLSGPPSNAPTAECVTYHGQIAIYI
jgi:hypothetical protein